MNLSTLSGNRTLRVAGVVIGISLAVALVAIFVFKVDPYTVLSFGAIGLFMASHLFMHGGHGGHEDHSQHTTNTPSGDQTTGADHAQHAQPADQKNEQTEHSGCH